MSYAILGVGLLYYSVVGFLLLAAIGFLVYTIKNRADDDDDE